MSWLGALKRLRQASLPSGELKEVLDDLLGIRYPSPRNSSEDAARMVECVLYDKKFLPYISAV
jgi:hypothetical protein